MSDALPPPYDPAVHTLDDNPTVRLAVYCACGELRRFVDPVAYVLQQLEDFAGRHHGAGHGPVTEEEALDEREARRQASFRAAGRQAEYEPKPHELTGWESHDWAAPPPEPTQAAAARATEEG